MSVYNRIAITLVRLVAAGLILVGVLNLGLEWYKVHKDHLGFNIWRGLYVSIPLWIGVAMLIKSAALARWVDQFLDE